MEEALELPPKCAKPFSVAELPSSSAADHLFSSNVKPPESLIQACAMAPMSEQLVSGQKRPLPFLEDGTHPLKKRRQASPRHHNLNHKPQAIPAAEPAILEQQALDKLLVDAIKMLCEEQGARRGIQDPVIESLALEAFRNATEEFILRFCAMVRKSMLSARRTVPIPPDFESALRCLDLPWPDDQLEPYKTEPTINPPMLPTPPPEDVFHRESQLPTSLLGPGLDSLADKRKDSYIPSHLPPFPSQHTYKATPVFPTREADPRRIRELATEEGKLGEEALRKLAGAVKVENTINSTPQAEEVRGRKVQKKCSVPEESMESMFEATMRDLLKSASSSGERFELGPVVNCEKRFLMQDTPLTTRRWPADHHKPSATPAPVGQKGGLSEKAWGKQRADDTRQDADML